MPYRLLENPYARSRGAMFMRGLGETVLVFVYPFAFPRLFTTIFCPPLRIIALDEDANVIYNRVVSGWRLIHLPATRLVLEMNAARDPAGVVEEIRQAGLDGFLSGIRTRDAIGAAFGEEPVDALLFALLCDALADLRSVTSMGLRAHDLRHRLSPWRRGQILGSADYVLQAAAGCSIPSGAIRLSEQIVEAEEEYREELFAAALAGGKEWKHEFASCFACGSPCYSWRPVLDSRSSMPPELSWRLDRPENAVPLCRSCAAALGVGREPEVLLSLAYGYWGYRFEALHRWYQSARSGGLPHDWDLYQYPLWPREYGGESWARGSGAVRHCAPRLGKAALSEEHVQRLLSVVGPHRRILTRRDTPLVRMLSRIGA